MGRIRVLQLISGIAIGDQSGGAERHAIQVAGLLDREVYESRIFAMQSFQSPQERQWLETLNQLGLPVEGLMVWQHRLTSDLYRVYKKLRFVTTDFRPDIIHSHSERADILGMLIHLAHPLHPIAFRTVHLDQQWITQPLLGSVLSRFIFPFFFNQEIGVSQEIYTKLASRGFSHVDKISLCYNGINASQFETTAPLEIDSIPIAINLDPPLVGIVGRLTEQKGHSVLLDAVSLVLEKRPVHLLIMGDGPLSPELQSQSNQLNLEGNVEFLGVRSDVMKILPNLDLFILPSRWEGFPTVILEAMSKKVPVIATDIPGSRELVRSDDTGTLVQVDNPQELSEAILYALDHPKELQRMAERAYAFASEFTIENTALCYEKIYSRAIEMKKPPAT
ncbi:MAG: glycosyltransferase family 4 protein [Anaerolineae bacterium]|nr:MAG: glycosyltransferase family 4 protein [Anaerolineae bacterium]